MRKLLIFTASIGGGHNEAANCIEQGFIKKDFTVKKIDILSAINKSLDTIISGSCKVMVNRFPKLYGNIYDMSNREKINKLFSHSFSKIAKEKISNIVDEEKPDLIIATHAFVVIIIGYLKDIGIIDTPFISVITDYEAHKTYIHRNVDAYIVANNHTKETLNKRGIPNNKIYPYGIPIKTEFMKDNKSAKEQEEVFQVLLMAGSLGLKSMRKVLRNLVEHEISYHIVVVCGKDEKLKTTIEKEFDDLINKEKITLYGFTHNIPSIMESSNILITKPGGLTISEAIAKELPMIIPYYIPGQEKENLDFLVNNGMAIYAYDINNIKNLVEDLMENPIKLNYMKENMKKLSYNFNVNLIVKLGEELIHQTTGKTTGTVLFV